MTTMISGPLLDQGTTCPSKGLRFHTHRGQVLLKLAPAISIATICEALVGLFEFLVFLLVDDDGEVIGLQGRVSVRCERTINQLTPWARSSICKLKMSRSPQIFRYTHDEHLTEHKEKEETEENTELRLISLPSTIQGLLTLRHI